ncbi:MAG TPA: Asp-tRNA(Asn)/Glu-tRNA(Gln) amidotransferase subunit GatB [Bacillota bacterium]|nr:Asp-tRNA(Asn)/Glu-tRNA(Gln) amidotransferase subunit GatB [Bacillota bacterium]
MPGFEPVIGLEVHVELRTRSKMFCGCSADFGAPPNTHVCPVCLGLPGALPVVNRQAVVYAMRAALALHGNIAEETSFDRKNYHYPDLAKGYQISQYQHPISTGGHLDVVRPDGSVLHVRLRRLHMEEDTGKSLHEGVPAGSSGVDFNRAGVPLIEIVMEADVHSPEDARLTLQTLRTVVLYTGVSDVRMEEGSLRCDANVSLRPEGTTAFGTLVEIKNMNSFRSVQRALEYEVTRQSGILGEGGRVARETRHWDERRGITFSSRSKEEADDYRYFPEPDLGALKVERAWVAAVAATMPELPESRRERYVGAGLSAYDAGVLVEDPPLADYFDAVVAAGVAARSACSWLTVELLGRLNGRGEAIGASKVGPEALAALIRLIEQGTISAKIGKDVLDAMVAEGGDPEAIVRARGLTQISDEGALAQAVRDVLGANATVVADFKSGKDKAFGFLVGQVMKATRGQANPGLVNTILRKELES